MQKITPCLWFDDKGAEAAKFYVSIFKNSKIGRLPVMEKQAQRSPEDRRVRS
jgi:predicted 3-demethylubiquinone-9 3-methyltransferase (glyoxalase superfamily)